jgi:hypothetical protein
MTKRDEFLNAPHKFHDVDEWTDWLPEPDRPNAGAFDVLVYFACALSGFITGAFLMWLW